MQKSSLNIVLIVWILWIPGFVYSQLTTSTAQTPAQLVQNVLVGNGVTVTNVTYSGGPDAIGSFNGSNTNVGLNSGIILTTGTVNAGTGLFGAQQGPHGPNNAANTGMDNLSGGNADLTALAGEVTFNATLLEFDFVPNSDSVEFRYVFASEEYPEFVNAGYNDVFAFFITGPGFGGAYNMATIPGTVNTPVTIDNVNAGLNSAYFVDNGTGNTAPQNSSSFYIQYDGFTTVLTAKAEVQCGESYHLEIAIADVGDAAFDSGIFLEANSLSSPKPSEMSATLSKNVFNNDSQLAEGCETLTVAVERPANQAGVALSIPFSTAGTATEGVDYSMVPANIVFPAGQTIVTFDIDIFADALTEGDETLKLILDQPDPCGNSTLIELDYVIKEVDPLVVELENDTVFCSGDNVDLQPVVSGGAQPYSYVWNTSQTSQNINVAPTVTTPYSITVTDDCNSTPVTENVVVEVPIYDPFILSATDDTSVLCPNTPVTLSASVQGGSGSNQFSWSNTNGIAGTNSSFVVSPFTTSTYNVTVENFCGEQVTKDITVTVESDVLTVATSGDVLICRGDEVEISANGLGGQGNFSYFWVHSGETTSNVTVRPQTTTTYNVVVADNCGTYSVPASVTVSITTPRAGFSAASSNLIEGLPIQLENTSSGAVQWEWDFGNGLTSNSIVPSTIYSTPGVYDIQQVAISEAGCRDSITKSIRINPEFYFYAPNAFTPDDNRFNSTYRVSVVGEMAFHFVIFNRWGEIIFESYDPNFEWDGTYGGQEVQMGVYIYKAHITDLLEQRLNFEGFITVVK